MPVVVVLVAGVGDKVGGKKENGFECQPQEEGFHAF